jgi:hypothetical protein
MKRVALAMGVVVVLAGGCGQAPELPQQVAAEFRDRMVAIRAATGAGDRAGAEARLAELRHRVVELQQAGQVDDTRAAEILGAAAEVEAQLATIPPPAPPPTTMATSPPPTEDGDRGHGRKKKDGDHDED